MLSWSHSWILDLTDTHAGDAEPAGPPPDPADVPHITAGEELVTEDFRFCLDLTFRLSLPNTPVAVAAFAGGSAVVGEEGGVQVIVKSDRRACIRVWSWLKLRIALGVDSSKSVCPPSRATALLGPPRPSTRPGATVHVCAWCVPQVR